MRWRFLLICFIVAITCVASRHFLLDDAFIYARYVRNALHGFGMVYNRGERVNALTSPLFAMLLLSGSWILHGHVLLADRILSGVFFAAACLMAEQLVPWAGLLIACTQYFYMCNGMETSLFLFMLSLLVFLYVDDKVDWLPTVAVLAMLSRFDGAVLVGVIAVQFLRGRRRPSGLSFLPAILILAGYLMFNHAFYGGWFPASVGAKFDQSLSGYWGRWPTAFLRMPRMIIDPFLPYFWIIPCALFFACVGIYKEGWSRLNRALVPFGFLFFGFCVFLNVVAMGWYYAPFFFFILMYAVRGLPKNRVAYCLLVITMLDAVSMGVYSQSKSTVPLTYVATAKWLRENTSPDAKVATVEIGTIGWYDDRYTDDIIGLTNPANARRLRHHDFYSWLPDQQPDYVVMHQRPAFGEMAADKSKDYEYLPVHFGDITLMKRKDSTR